ncbi:hypothetical protein P7C71_g628, partial [Lecanoromycetidae sp. Uapishka_2]
MADKYLLRVTAGPSYDPSTHETVLVNTSTPTHISSSTCSANLAVRIQNYRGLPRNSPTTSPYFSHDLHTHDQYSISFTLLLKKPIPGSALLFGNDFDHPIRDRLPPGFGSALKIVKWGIDPGLEGDVYSDKPHLYGNALSSVNVLRVGEKTESLPEPDGEEAAIEEGADGEGEEWRKSRNVPSTADARKKHFLIKGTTQEWSWEEGRVYKADFFNPYLDFNGFALKLPGFSLSILPYLGGEDYLRYVLKNKDTDEVLFVIVFTLLKKEDVEKEEAESVAKAGDLDDSKEDNEGAAEDESRHEGETSFEPEASDVD